MASVTICSDLEPQNITSLTVSIISPSICHNTHYTFNILATTSLVPLRSSSVFQENPIFFTNLMSDSLAPIHSIAGSGNVLSVGPGQPASLTLPFQDPALISQDFRQVQKLKCPVWTREIGSVLESWWKISPVFIMLNYYNSCRLLVIN